MRCCKVCGCYLPDGRTACLACGFDEATRYTDTRPEYTSPMMLTVARVRAQIANSKFEYNDETHCYSVSREDFL